MLEYAHNQDRWMADFVSVFDKMMSNGYSSLTAGEDQSANIACSPQASRASAHCAQLVTQGVGNCREMKIMSLGPMIDLFLSYPLSFKYR